MAIDKIITQNELNYIETLYLYANLEDFISYKSTALNHLLGEINQHTNKRVSQRDIDNMYGEERYLMMLEYVQDTMLHKAKSEPKKANNRLWYGFDNYRLGIMEYDKSKKMNQYNVVIQYEQHHMFTLSKDLKGLELPFGGNFNQYHIQRIDICKIFKSPINYTIGYNYLSPYRNPNGHDRSRNTVYLGNRKNGNVFRMYPKTIELKETESYKKMELLSSYFGDIEDLYTFELELHRNHLKEVLNIDTLDDLEKVYLAYKNIVGKIRIYEDNDKNKKLLKQGNRSRMKGVYVTDYVDYERVLKKRYKTSKSYAMNRHEKTFNRYVDSMGIKEESVINSLRLEFAMSIASNDKQDVIIEFEDNDSVFEFKEMLSKHEKIRKSEDNSLQIEAKKAFLTAPTLLQKPQNLF